MTAEKPEGPVKVPEVMVVTLAMAGPAAATITATPVAEAEPAPLAGEELEPTGTGETTEPAKAPLTPEGPTGVRVVVKAT